MFSPLSTPFTSTLVSQKDYSKRKKEKKRKTTWDSCHDRSEVLHNIIKPYASLPILSKRDAMLCGNFAATLRLKPLSFEYHNMFCARSLAKLFSCLGLVVGGA